MRPTERWTGDLAVKEAGPWEKKKLLNWKSVSEKKKKGTALDWVLQNWWGTAIFWSVWGHQGSDESVGCTCSRRLPLFLWIFWYLYMCFNCSAFYDMLEPIVILKELGNTARVPRLHSSSTLPLCIHSETTKAQYSLCDQWQLNSVTE